MKIVDVKLTQVCCPAPTTLRWGRRATDTMGGIIVQVLTDEGITGLGEFEAPYPEARTILESTVLPRIRGENPLHIERLWRILHGTRYAAGHARCLGVSTLRSGTSWARSQASQSTVFWAVAKSLFWFTSRPR